MTVSTTGFWNLDLTCQIHLIHWKLGLNSAGNTQCIIPHSSSPFIFLDPNFYQIFLIYVYALSQRDNTSPTWKTFMCILNFTNPSSSIETVCIILVSTCAHAIKIGSWKFAAVGRHQSEIFVICVYIWNISVKSRTAFRQVWVHVN